jgi:hypothetical protein
MNIGVHELVAIGVGLANAGGSVMQYVYGTNSDENKKSYQMGGLILLLEIIHSPFLSLDLKNDMLSDLNTKKTVIMDKKLKAVSQIPTEELRRIGERMAKLGIYMTRKE